MRAQWYCPALEGGRCELTVDGKTGPGERGGGCPLAHHSPLRLCGGITAVAALESWDISEGIGAWVGQGWVCEGRCSPSLWNRGILAPPQLL